VARHEWQTGLAPYNLAFLSTNLTSISAMLHWSERSERKRHSYCYVSATPRVLAAALLVSEAVAGDGLSTAVRTPLHITPNDMKFAGADTAVVTRPSA
jgi:hypothetical protein